MSDTPTIEVTPTPAAPSTPDAGVPHGTVLETLERIVHDLDEAGNVIGWHKEPVAQEGQ